MNNDELQKFFEVALSLRKQCEASNDSAKDKALKISALAQVCFTVFRFGKVPRELRIQSGAGTPVKTELVQNLFDILNIKIRVITRSTRSEVSYATFNLAE